VKTFKIQGKTGRSNIYVGERLENLSVYLPDTKVVIITDENVSRLYSGHFPDSDIIIIGIGEGVKTLDTAAEIYQKLIAIEADRSVFLVGVGGGIVCDITGFVASTYLRGVRFGNVATTLLAQVDASVGGKTGVNFMGYKNMVGVFNQPEFVLCDQTVLKTLPEKVLYSGFAEVIKHAAIADADYFSYLESNVENALAQDAEVLERVIYDSVKIKAGVVNRDETEQGERRKLNFGHTYGHAVEKTIGMSHGEAVSIGMMIASALSKSKGMLTKTDVDRIGNLLSKMNLPTAIDTNTDKIIDAMARDKKREGDQIHFVLLSEIGRAVIEQIPINEIEDVVKQL